MLTKTTKTYANQEHALAQCLKLGLAGKPFTFGKKGKKYAVTLDSVDEHLIAERPRNAHCVVQEGGSSTEIYLHVYGSVRDARRGQASCGRAAYRTSDIVEVSPLLDALGEYFYAPAEALLEATLDFS